MTDAMLPSRRISFASATGPDVASLQDQPLLGQESYLYPRLVGVGTAMPLHSHSQREIFDIFGIAGPRVRPAFLKSAIERRSLSLPPGTQLQCHPDQGTQLASRHRQARRGRHGL
jgi:hypothetical protein